MRKLSIVVIIAFSLIFVPARRADEGMWTFDNPPLKQWKEKYGFEPSREWLDHVRLSTVRLSEGAGGGTGSFVSADGLVFTNQHVGAGQVAKLSSGASGGGRDLVKEGFYARTRDQELKCPDLEVNVMVSYEDVTKRVQGAVKPEASDKDAAAQRKAEMAAIEKEETAKTGLKCEVVTLYSGGEYWLYRFKRYADVRLVFAPEEQIAYFGGDYDNFTFPRYDLDITFFRVYENGQPAKIEHFLKWASPATGEAVREGELVIVPGFPGSTARLLTAAQIRYHRDVGNPLQMQVWTSRSAALKKYSARGPEQQRQASQTFRGLENSIKRLVGQQAGLENPRIFKKKEDEEAALRKAVASKPEWRRAYGDAWTRIEKAYQALPAMSKRIAFTSLSVSRLGLIASNFVRYAEEVRKPNEERYEEFRDNRLEALKRNMLSPAPIYPEMEEAILAAWLEEGKKTLGESDPFIRAAIGDSTPAEVAKGVTGATKLNDLSFRKALFEGGADAISKSSDPLVELARKVEPIIRELRAWNEEKIQNVETSAGAKIAEARFAVYGKSVYPDANFNLRIEYGTVAGYEEDTTLVPFKTTFYGLYDRANSFNEKPPYNLPPHWRDAKSVLNLSTPLNFVYSADTIGGNSGSPVINRNAEIVGINFDSNIQKLPNRYLYIDENEGARAVGVHAAAIIEALQKIYGANALIAEIRGG
ncbi:MAG: S46 family peptidase [Acidobacteria bacterium]|nr:S46 family peptidase [Acidobacteriota bacterium]